MNHQLSGITLRMEENVNLVLFLDAQLVMNLGSALNALALKIHYLMVQLVVEFLMESSLMNMWDQTLVNLVPLIVGHALGQMRINVLVAIAQLTISVSTIRA